MKQNVERIFPRVARPKFYRRVVSSCFRFAMSAGAHIDIARVDVMKRRSARGTKKKEATKKLKRGNTELGVQWRKYSAGMRERRQRRSACYCLARTRDVRVGTFLFTLSRRRIAKAAPTVVRFPRFFLSASSLLPFSLYVNPFSLSSFSRSPVARDRRLDSSSHSSLREPGRWRARRTWSLRASSSVSLVWLLIRFSHPRECGTWMLRVSLYCRWFRPGSPLSQHACTQRRVSTRVHGDDGVRSSLETCPDYRRELVLSPISRMRFRVPSGVYSSGMPQRPRRHTPFLRYRANRRKAANINTTVSKHESVY